MRIAITGGTGFVGTHAVRALVAAGHEVRVIARGERRRPRRSGVSFTRADVVNGAGLVDALQGCGAVIHLVAVIRERGRQTFDRVNRQGTENVARAARKAGVGHLIHLSALGADPNPRYPYLASKWAGEQAVRTSGVPHTIIRSSLIFGPGDGFFTRLTRLIRFNPVIPVVGDGRALFQPVAAADMARCIVAAVENGPRGRTIDVGGPDHLTYEQIVTIIKNQIGAHRFVVHVPVEAMRPLAWLMDRVLPDPPVTPGQLRLLERDSVTRRDAIARTFGFTPRRFADSAAYLERY